MSSTWYIGLMLVMLFSGTAFGQLSLVPMKYSKVKLVSGRHSLVVDLDDVLTDNGGTMPGNAPHQYRVLFTTAKDGFLYLVANIRSHSPVSDKNAPCGGDSPQGIIWIKTDKKLAAPEFKSEIYESCSLNFYDSKVNKGRNNLYIEFGGKKKSVLRYSNLSPEKGLIVSPLFDLKGVK
ncbi:MAG: hypothetical protein JO053_16130 [Acidobacteria bacterium]|nr:hypothetical protein [Acidobacteriota bacterium]